MTGSSSQAPSASNLSSFGSQLEDRIDRIFAPLCATLPPDRVPQLQDQVQLHVRRAHEALRHNEFLDVPTVENVATVIVELLDSYTDHSQEQQALIVGAARYFTEADDAEPDTLSLLGFDDDVAVLNYVLDRLGMVHRKLEL